MLKSAMNVHKYRGFEIFETDEDFTPPYIVHFKYPSEACISKAIHGLLSDAKRAIDQYLKAYPKLELTLP